MRTAIFWITILSSLFLLTEPVAGAEDKKSMGKPNEPEIIERIITIEGSLEKPRVIFIIPRTKLWRDDVGRKSFAEDILTPVYPEHLINKEFYKNPARR